MNAPPIEGPALFVVLVVVAILIIALMGALVSSDSDRSERLAEEGTDINLLRELRKLKKQNAIDRNRK
jgi:hypothetical protein